MKKTLLGSVLCSLLLVAPVCAQDGPVTYANRNLFGVGTYTVPPADGVVIREVEITGVTVFASEQVRSLIRIKPGSVYGSGTLKEDLSSIRDLYENDEWVIDDIEARVDMATGKLSIHVVEATVQEVRVVGNEKTRNALVLQNLATRTGSVLNRRAFQRDLERLKNLGYFRSVEPDFRRGVNKGQVILVLDVEEEKTGLATIGVGYAGGGMSGIRTGITAPPTAESYEAVEETGFREVAQHALSTFSIDVDTASYANVRRFLSKGTLPYVDAVRVEELINYFSYSYPQPKGEVPFAVATELSNCPWNSEYQLLRVGLQGRRTESKRTPPRNLVFLLDVSGSMEDPDKLPLVQRSMQLLLSTLGKDDHVAIVVYAGREEVVLPSTSCASKALISARISTLRSGGATNGSAGIEMAYQTARENFQEGAINRVILCTDGDFNVGLTGAALDSLIEKERDGGVFLTVLGFGEGNLKDDTMESLADKGNGNYAYIDGLLEAQKVLVREAGSTLETIAKDVKLQIEFNPKRVHSYRLVGYENRRLEDEDFQNDQKDAGDLGAGHNVTALYEIVPEGPTEESSLRYQRYVSTDKADSGELALVKLRYKEPTGDKSRLVELPISDRLVPFAQASEDTRFAASVAAFGMVLRDSEFKGQADLSKVEQWARTSVGADPSGDRHEFLKLVGLANSLRSVADGTR